MYAFRMAQPIPAYLLALAVGEVEYRSVGERCAVYATPDLIDKAAYEFAEIEFFENIGVGCSGGHVHHVAGGVTSVFEDMDTRES